MINKCKAKNPATCPYHGVSFIANVLYEKDNVNGIKLLPIEDYEEFVKQIELVLEKYNYANDAYSNPVKNIGALVDTFRANYDDYESIEYGSSSFNLTEAIQEIVFLKDEDKTKLPETNLLDPVTVSSSYGKYEHAIASYLATKGLPVDPTSSYYGWQDYRMSEHVRKCGISAVSSATETSWREFQGTFDDSDDTLHGLCGQGQCECGFFKGQLRVEGNLTNMVRDLIEKY